MIKQRETISFFLVVSLVELNIKKWIISGVDMYHEMKES